MSWRKYDKEGRFSRYIYRIKYMRKLSSSIIHEHLSIKGGKLISEYTNQRDKLLWECDKGHQWQASWDSIYHAKSWCPVCGVRQKPSIDEIKLYAQSKTAELVSTEYLNNKTPLTWHCLICDTVWKTPWGNVKNQGQWCPTCSANKLYINEKNAIAIAAQLFGKSFRKTKMYKGVPKEIRYFEFDGYNKELNIAIEYNGIQHYKYHSWFHASIEDFEYQLKRDALKRDFCKNNNIILIEIPYTKNTKVKEFLLSYINNHNLSIEVFV